jgi:hypothetical protein
MKQKEVLKHYRIFKLDYQAIHDIRLFFPCEGLRSILLLSDTNLISGIDERSNKDITLRDITLDDITLKVTVHNTDTVTVMVSCSESPIPLDYIGVSKLSSALTRVEERLQRIIDEFTKKRVDQGITDKADYSIPYHMSWIVKMWHFGYDSEPRFSGSSVEITWKEHLQLFRYYLKKSRRVK